MLFIKVKKHPPVEVNEPLHKMPALIYVEDEDGKVLKLKAVKVGGRGTNRFSIVSGLHTDSDMQSSQHSIEEYKNDNDERLLSRNE